MVFFWTVLWPFGINHASVDQNRMPLPFGQVSAHHVLRNNPMQRVGVGPLLKAA
jgi:hypothetical protein